MSSSRLARLAVPIAVVTVVVMMVVPLPSVVLDVLIALNIAASLIVLLISMQVRKPLEFAVFPTVVLVATLFRLALNVSATRLVLRDGFAGHVIDAFSHIVIGSSLIIGPVVFAILIIIQLTVVTNGAARVAEVGARFTLDAMPGKQMAIDADLTSGLIDEDTARRRRAEVAAEADFYGAMDGGTKFVKGDAIAAIIISFVTVIGGFAVGILQRGMEPGEAVTTYSLLTVGDGLVSQIPALLMSVATGVIVTRSTSESDVGGLVLLLSTRSTDIADEPTANALGPAAAREALPAAPATQPDPVTESLRLDPLELLLAPDLIDLVEAARGGDLLDRVRALRRKTALDLGIVLPPVLAPGSYEIRIGGVSVATGEAPAGYLLAIGDAPDMLPGPRNTEPVFGLPAIWVPVEHRATAEAVGATLVERAAVVTTHLAEMVRRHTSRLLSLDDVRELLEVLKAERPAAVEELVPGLLPLSAVQRILQGLLDEQVSIRDLARVLEGVGQRARGTTDPGALLEAARSALGPALTAPYARDGVLHAITLDPMAEASVAEALRASEQGAVLALDALAAQRLVGDIGGLVTTAEQRGDVPVLLAAGPLRLPLRRLLRGAIPQLPVIAFSETAGIHQIETVGQVSRGHELAA